MQKTIKNKLSDSIFNVIKKIAAENNLPEYSGKVKIEYPPKAEMGNYSTPVAMELARIFKDKPSIIAENILSELKKDTNLFIYFEEAKIQGPGFINFYLSETFYSEFFNSMGASGIENIQKTLYSREEGAEEKPSVIFEFVSANPTGPLNIVSARAAAVGDSICRIMRKTCIPVHSEYYVNDYGNQVRLLGLSFSYRYLQSLGAEISLPEDCYQGQYIIDVLKEILDEGMSLPKLPASIEEYDQSSELWKEYINSTSEVFAPAAIERLRQTHENDLGKFRVHFDQFFSEKTLHDSDQVMSVEKELESKGFVYVEEKAKFFRSTDFDDDKDRVIVRADGRPTYLMADIAYHKTKINRGYSKIMNIWGPDHHGYIARLSGAISALGFGPNNKSNKHEEFRVLIVQQVNMIEDGKSVVMSKRLGKFHTMHDLLKNIPVDVVRYFFLMRSQSSHLDFDLDLALTESNKNPVYYIQYAHARINSIFREAAVDINEPISMEVKGMIKSNPSREKLLAGLYRYFEIVEDISTSLEVHLLADYLYETASLFTSFYHDLENRVVKKLKDNREEGMLLLGICQWTKWILHDGLELLGVSAPEKM